MSSMKRIVIDVTDAQHEYIKEVAIKQKVTISNLIRAFLGLPQQRQGERTDLNGKSHKKSPQPKDNA